MALLLVLLSVVLLSLVLLSLVLLSPVLLSLVLLSLVLLSPNQLATEVNMIIAVIVHVYQCLFVPSVNLQIFVVKVFCG